MKTLTPEQIDALDLSQAWDISEEYSVYLMNRKKAFEFDSALPYPKNIILLALLKILVEQDVSLLKDGHTLKEQLCTSIMLLNDHIPEPEIYEREIKIRKRLNEMQP